MAAHSVHSPYNDGVRDCDLTAHLRVPVVSIPQAAKHASLLLA